MTIEIVEASPAALPEYARVPIAFTVDRLLDVATLGGTPERFGVSERRLDIPYEKNYDSLAGEGPLHWPLRFDLTNWTFFTARLASRIVGGAAVVFDTPQLTMREGRRDIAVLWDIRVSPDVRGQGVGSALFEKAEAWARSRGCRQLEIETQNTNVVACRFYERHGCELRGVQRAAYPELPDEIQLLWYRTLRS